VSVRDLLKRSVTLRLLARWARVNTYAYPHWTRILDGDRDRWEEAVRKASGGPRVLIATGVGGHPYAVALESLLGVALTLRGAEVHYLLCDRLLPACELTEYTWFPDTGRFVRKGPQRSLCRVCFEPGRRTYRQLGLPLHTYGEFWTGEDRQQTEAIVDRLPREEIEAYRLDGLAVGEHAKAGALRFFGRGTIDDEPHAEGVLRRYLRAALIAAMVGRRALARYDFQCAIFQHGIYVPQGVLGEVARAARARVVNWNVAYRKQRFIFSHGDTYHRTMMTEPTANWEHLVLTAEHERDLLGYLRSRWHGAHDWIWFQERPIEDFDTIASQLGLDRSKPLIGMLTNVMWDAQIHYPNNAFPNMLDWAVKTIAYFAGRPEVQLVIRVHPAEIRGTLPSRQPMVEEIRKRFPTLPPNVFVIGPGEPVSTYAVMLQCDSVIIYGTKTGVEITSQGIPVVVGGEAWIRGKGVSWDAASEADYFQLLDTLPTGGRLDGDVVRRARAYAYHFFFRRMIPLEFTEPTGGWLPYRLRVDWLADLQEGRSAGLDVICDGILHGSEFIYPEERQARVVH
jgi:hypothetical protein